MALSRAVNDRGWSSCSWLNITYCTPHNFTGATSTLNISGCTLLLGQVCSSQGDHSFVLPDSQILRLKTMRLDACVTFLHLKVTLQQNPKNTRRTVFAKYLCLYLSCFPLSCAESAVVEPLIDNPSLVATAPPVWPLACSSTLACSSAPHLRKKSLKQKEETSQIFCNPTPSVVETLRQNRATQDFLQRDSVLVYCQHIKYKRREIIEACLCLILLNRSKPEPREQGELPSLVPKPTCWLRFKVRWGLCLGTAQQVKATRYQPEKSKLKPAESN